ncbi:MAG: hypothetical protein QM784_35520 [Polyangiaceae bacterium]
MTCWHFRGQLPATEANSSCNGLQVACTLRAGCNDVGVLPEVAEGYGVGAAMLNGNAQRLLVAHLQRGAKPETCCQRLPLERIQSSQTTKADA